MSITHHGVADGVIMRAIGTEILRRWARHRLAEDPNGSPVARLERAVLEEMAAFFGFTKAEFVKQVTRFMPESAPPSTRANRNGQAHDQR